MGKNRDRDSLIRIIVNTVVHLIVLKNTNRPESKGFISSEVIEYRGRVSRDAKKYHWNESDKTHIRNKALQGIREKMNTKYDDIEFDDKEALGFLDGEIGELLDF